MGKNFLLEVKSLINRIENPETINESNVGFRFIDKSENLPDLLAGLKPGKMFTFGYVNLAEIVVPIVKRRNPETNRMKSYEDYAQLGKNLDEEGEVVNVIKLSMYNFPWQEQNRVKQRYSDWRAKRDELAGRFGVTYGKARYGTEMNNFGGGIESYKGNNPELSDHTYLNFNLHNIYPFSTTYYLLFSDGSIKQVDEKKLEFKAKNSYDELQKLRDAGATEADLECLIGMNYRKFENSKILFVSGTEMDGVPTLLINDNLSDKISGIAGVNRDAIVQIAKDRYANVLNVNEGKCAVFVENKSVNHPYVVGYRIMEALNLGRIYKHGADGFVVLSANRSSVDSENKKNDLTNEYLSWCEENDVKPSSEAEKEYLKQRNKVAEKELFDNIKDKGYTYSLTYGGYHGSDNVVDSFEPSFVVYNHKKSSKVCDWDELFNFAIWVCREYKQDSVYIQAPNEAPNYYDSEGHITNSSSSKKMKFNRDNETYYTTTKRDKDNPQRYTADIVFEGRYYKSEMNHEYVDRIRRIQNGEIFLG